MSQFVNLHSHSTYSIRDAIAKIDDMVVRAIELKHPAVCLTDHGTLSGAFVLYNTAIKKGIKPLLGVEIYMATRSRFEKEAGIDKYFHLTLIAMNNIGWKNIVKLVSEAYKEEHFYYKPRIDRELLKQYNEGIICLSGCCGSNVSNSILRDLKLDFEDEEGNKTKKLECSTHDNTIIDIFNESYLDTIKWHQNVFKDRFYLEVQNHHMSIEGPLNDVLIDSGKKLGIKVVGTGDTHFVHEEDEKAHDIMLAIRDNITIHDERMKKIKYPGDGYHMQSYEEMCARFPGHKEVIDNTMEIVDRCNVTFNTSDSKIPSYSKYIDEDQLLEEMTFVKLSEIYGDNIPKNVADRANQELNTIKQMTFANYFLMVADYVNWAKEQNIFVGPGRGSAAGSIVAYAMGITDVDPLKYDLSFSRFLNSGRAAHPQINFPEYPIDNWIKLKNKS